jgi:hypothetical protein
VSEQGFDDGLIKGIPDILEPDEEDVGFYILYDYKTSGSFKVALALGLTKIQVPYIDDYGHQVLLKTGKNKGLPKTKQGWAVDLVKGHSDIKDWIFQMNRYRISVEFYGFPISKMIVQCIPRDGNTYIAKQRGVDKNVILVEIPRLDDQMILDHYANLQAEINEAFATGRARICNSEESWDGRKCKGYCPVHAQCKEMEQGATFGIRSKDDKSD